MILTKNEELAIQVRLFRNFGQRDRYYHDFIGINSRLDEIQAAILRVKLNYLNDRNNRRKEKIILYNELLEDSDGIPPIEKEYCKHIYHLHVILSKNREKLQIYLKKNQIQTYIHYFIPVHLSKAYIKYKNTYNLPITLKVCNDVLSLPMHPWITEKEIMKVTKLIKKNI